MATFLLCLIISFAVFFFLLPRSIQITSQQTHIRPYNLTYIRDLSNSSTTGVIILFEETYMVKNHNFYSVTMKNLTLQLNRNSRVSLPQLSYKQNMRVSARGSETIHIKIKYSLYTLYDPYVDLCINNVISDLFTMVSTYFSFSTLWTSDQRFIVDTMQYIYCSNQSVYF